MYCLPSTIHGQHMTTTAAALQPLHTLFAGQYRPPQSAGNKIAERGVPISPDRFSFVQESMGWYPFCKTYHGELPCRKRHESYVSHRNVVRAVP